MKNKIFRSLYLIVFFGLLSIATCLAQTNKAIVGKWKGVEKGSFEVMIFYKEGTVVIKDEGRQVAGDYRFIDKNTLRLDVYSTGLKAVIVATISLKGNYLSMKDVISSAADRYIRVK